MEASSTSVAGDKHPSICNPRPKIYRQRVYVFILDAHLSKTDINAQCDLESDDIFIVLSALGLQLDGCLSPATDVEDLTRMAGTFSGIWNENN